MNYRRLGRSGLRLSELSFVSWVTYGNQMDEAVARECMAAAFDAYEIARVLVEDGRIGHAESRIGDSVVMAFDAKDDWPETPAFLRLYVDDCDASYEQALKAGGSSVTKPTDMPCRCSKSWIRRSCNARWPIQPTRYVCA